MNIIDYTLVGGESWKDVVEGVNQHIKKGWQPLGGIDHTTTTGVQTKNAYHYVQVLVKYEKEQTSDPA